MALFTVDYNHPIPMLEKDRYENRRLKLIVYQHNLHMWYMVVYISGIWVLLEISSWRLWR
jgi:hypothetical protein